MSGDNAELSLLGVPEIRVGSTATRLHLPENAFALAAVLFLRTEDHSLSRRAAASLLWERRTAESNSNLRQLIGRIRKRQAEAGFDLFTFDHTSIRIAVPTAVDVLRLRDLGATRRPEDALEVSRLYRGDLLLGYDSGSPELIDWIRTERQSLRDRFVGCLAEFLSHASEGDAVTERTARLLLDYEPAREVGWRALMSFNAARDDVSGLHRTFLDCCEKVRIETGGSPRAKTLRHYDTLCRTLGVSLVEASLPNRAPAEAVPVSPPGVALDPIGVPRICLLPPASSTRSVGHAIAASVIEDVTTEFCRLATLTTIAPHTAWRLGEPDEAAIDRFGIDYLVRSAVQVSGSSRRIAVHLLNARSREILWAEQFPCGAADVAAGYRAISMQILTSLSARIEHHELARYAAGRPPTAYYHYLLGLRQSQTLTLPAYRRARRHFKDSVSIDDRFEPAWGALARTYQREWLLLSRSNESLLDQAEEHSRKAIAVDPYGVHGLHQLGQCSLFRGRIEDCLSQYSEAERRSPNYADLLADHAGALGLGIDPPLALRKIAKAMELNPLCPDYYFWAQGIAFYASERYAEAASALGQVKQPGPALRMLAASHAMAGNLEEARRHVRKTLQIYPDFRVADWLKTFPFPNPTFRAAYETGLMAAGFT